MGRPMVARLVAAGHTVRVLGRNPAKRRDLAQSGAIAVHDITEAGVLDDAIGAFSVRHESTTVSVTVRHSAGTAPARDSSVRSLQ